MIFSESLSACLGNNAWNIYHFTALSGVHSLIGVFDPVRICSAILGMSLRYYVSRMAFQSSAEILIQSPSLLEM